jgi:hypothetical protein
MEMDTSLVTTQGLEWLVEARKQESIADAAYCSNGTTLKRITGQRPSERRFRFAGSPMATVREAWDEAFERLHAFLSGATDLASKR